MTKRTELCPTERRRKGSRAVGWGPEVPETPQVVRVNAEISGSRTPSAFPPSTSWNMQSNFSWPAPASGQCNHKYRYGCRCSCSSRCSRVLTLHHQLGPVYLRSLGGVFLKEWYLPTRTGRIKIIASNGMCALPSGS